MGERAHFIIRRQGQLDLRYAHWGAPDVGLELFWGPGPAVSYILAQRPTDEWMDEVSCEGAGLVDFDTRTVLFYGGAGLDLDTLPMFLELMRVLWPGWQVRVAHEGLVEIARHLGLDPTPMHHGWSVPWSSRPEVLLEGQPGEEPESLVSILAPEGVRDVGPRFPLATVLGMGPAVLPVLVRLPRLPLGQARRLDRGALIRPAERRLEIYFLLTSCHALEGVRAAWPGWEVVACHDGLAGHIRRSGRAAGRYRPSRRRAFGLVRRALLAPREDPVQRLVETIRPLVAMLGQGGRAELSLAAGALSHRVGPLSAKERAALVQFAADVAEGRLPPDAQPPRAAEPRAGRARRPGPRLRQPGLPPGGRRR